MKINTASSLSVFFSWVWGNSADVSGTRMLSGRLFLKRFAQHKVASPREAIKKGYDVAVPELLIMILVEFRGETYRAEIGRRASCAGRNAPGLHASTTRHHSRRILQHEDTNTS